MSKHSPHGLYLYKASSALRSSGAFWVKPNAAGAKRIYLNLSKLIWSDRNPPTIAKRIAPIQLMAWNNDKTAVAK